MNYRELLKRYMLHVEYGEPTLQGDLLELHDIRREAEADTFTETTGITYSGTSCHFDVEGVRLKLNGKPIEAGTIELSDGDVLQSDDPGTFHIESS